MKIGFIGENGLEGVEADSRLAAEHGFDGIEYNFWAEFRHLSSDKVKQMAGIHRKYGAKACMLGMWGFNLLAASAAEREETLKLMDQLIEYAQVLQAPWIVTGCGDIEGEPLGRKVQAFARDCVPFLEKAKKAGLQVAFYALHSNSFMDSLEAMERVWEVVPELKLKFDPANWARHGHDYLGLARRYGHKIGYVHIKDAVYHEGHVVDEPPAGMGDIQFPKLLASLYRHGYDGYLSIESHGIHWSQGELRRKNILIAKRYLEPMLVD